MKGPFGMHDASGSTSREPWHGSDVWRVTAVPDGDTIHLESPAVARRKPELKVHLVGVDAPDMGYGNRKSERFCGEATACLRELVLGQLVRIRADRMGDDVDCYSRLLRHVVRHDDDMDVNREVIRLGWARLDRFEFEPSVEARYDAAEREAKKARRGVWNNWKGDQTPRNYKPRSRPRR